MAAVHNNTIALDDILNRDPEFLRVSLPTTLRGALVLC